MKFNIITNQKLCIFRYVCNIYKYVDTLIYTLIYTHIYTQSNAYQKYLGVPDAVRTKHRIQELKNNPN